jgi:large subunit ribosomal protein L15
VTPEVLVAVGLIKSVNHPVVILGDGDIRAALTVQAHRFSASAREKIEAAGGKAVEIKPA